MYVYYIKTGTHGLKNFRALAIKIENEILICKLHHTKQFSEQP